jgi:hypothetical protein
MIMLGTAASATAVYVCAVATWIFAIVDPLVEIHVIMVCIPRYHYDSKIVLSCISVYFTY